MISVLVKKQSNYPINTKNIKKHLTTLLEQRGVVSDAEVSVALVGRKKMLDLSKQYLNDEKMHNVLSFPSDEVKETFVFPPNETIHLGEIVVCYPLAVEEAKKEQKLVEDKVLDLIEHGALHLLGVHHS